MPRPDRRHLRDPSPLRVAVNGAKDPAVFFMRPGAVERWRVLNGSVDGRGFQRFMVLEGQYVNGGEQLYRVVDDESEESGRRLEPVSRQQIEDAKQRLDQLAWDGMTLVTVENGKARYTIKDLSKQNSGTQNPLARPIRENEPPYPQMLRNYEDCFRDGESIRNCFVRPNEVYMAPANRARRLLPGAARW